VLLSDARTELAGRGFDYLETTRMDIMLNRAVVDFEDFYPWPWLRKTVTGALPLTITDLKFVLSVYDSNATELFGINDSADFDRTETGTPSGWWIDDTGGSPVLTANPVGAATVTVRYVAESSSLVNPTDSPKIPSRYHAIWIDQAVVYAYEDSDNFAAATQLQQQVNGRLQQLVERYETRDRMSGGGYVLIRAGSDDD
jgi:hypothetical protein